MRAARSTRSSRWRSTLGGTVTGEHGVGLLKRPYLAGELGDAHDLHRAIKAALDPSGIFNPGKAV